MLKREVREREREPLTFDANEKSKFSFFWNFFSQKVKTKATKKKLSQLRFEYKL
jgi:hypothetical protein